MADIFFKPICESCRREIKDVVDCKRIEIQSELITKKYEILPNTCPYCGVVFDRIVIPTTLPYDNSEECGVKWFNDEDRI